MSVLTALRTSSRNVLVAGGSLAALLSIVLFVVSPTSTALELESAEAGRAPAGTQVFYGKFVDASGDPIKGAKVSVLSKTKKVVASATTKKDGTYRVSTKLASGSYTVAVKVKSGSKTVTSSTKVKVRSGQAYQVSGKIRKKAYINFLPISTY